MKQLKEKVRWSMLPLSYKLAVYFLLIVFAMLILLWTFQIVFLDSFYKTIKSTQVEQYAKQISISIRNDNNIETTISNASKRNEMSVYLYDTSSPIFLKRYTSDYNNPSGKSEFEEHQAYRYYRKALDNGGTYLGTTTTMTDTQTLRQFSDSLTAEEEQETLDTTRATEALREEVIAPRSASTERYENMVYAEIINLEDGKQNFLLINAMITPVSSVVDTLRIQLVIVSVTLVLFAIALSVYAARKIAHPLSKINKSAKELAKQNYDVEFTGSGYLEVKELNDTLNYARRELSKVEQLRQELIANISHDLRTPLTMIKGYGEVMRDLPGENTPENVQIIIDEASRLSSLVSDLMDLSKLQAGAMQLDAEVFCLTDSIRGIFQRYAKLKEQDGYNIVFNSSEDVFVNGDELKLGQVIYNLVNNAVNYAGEDKTVIVDQIVKNNRVRIEVTDHGVGIPPDKLEYIWDRYYKVDKEHKSAVIGTGLGLSIVKKILELHHAEYGVASKVDEGSTFWFEMDFVRMKKYIETEYEDLDGI